jgi:hypothetical protein
LNSKVDLKILIKDIEDRLDKYVRWEKEKINQSLIPKALLVEILKRLKKDRKGMERYVRGVLDEQQLFNWEKKKQTTINKFQEEQTKYEYK